MYISIQATPWHHRPLTAELAFSVRHLIDGQAPKIPQWIVYAAQMLEGEYGEEKLMYCDSL